MSPVYYDNTVMTIDQVCARLKISKATFFRCAKTDDFPRKIKLSPRRIGYFKSDIERYLSDRQEAA